MTIELSKDAQDKVDSAKDRLSTNDSDGDNKSQVPKAKNIKAKSNVTTFEFMACSSGKIPGCNLTIDGHVKSFTPGKKYEIDLLAMDKLPKQIARGLAPIFKQYQKKHPLCIGHNYGGLQVGLNQNDSTTWANVLSYQDGTVFFTSSRVLPLGGIDSVKAKMAKHATPANRSGGTWAGWSIKKGVPESKDMATAIKAILG